MLLKMLFCLYVSEFLRSQDVREDFENLPDEELACQLRVFYASARQKSKTDELGKEYSKSAYRNLRCGIQRYLVSPPINRRIDIIKDKTFQSANQVYDGKLKLLKKSGLDVTCHKPAIEVHDMDKMYSSGVLSTSNPVALQRKVFVEIGLHCGRRGREGWRELQRDSFVQKIDSDGRKYFTLCYHEFDKNHRLNEVKDQRIYEVPESPLCPFASMELYLSKLHPLQKALFQRPEPRYEGKQVWYQNAALGVHSLVNMLKNISRDAGLSREYTNHCLKASTATILKRAGVECQDIMSVTGHKNVASLNSYAEGPSNAQRAKMSNILGLYGKKAKPGASATVSTPPADNMSLVPVDPVPSTADIDMGSVNVENDNTVVVTTTCDDNAASVNVLTTSSSSLVENTSALFYGAVFNGPVNINVQLNK